MDQSQRELRRAAAKAFMESLEQLGQEFQNPVDKDNPINSKDTEDTDPSSLTASVPLEQLLEIPLSSDIALPEQDADAID